MIEREHVLELCAGYALGALSAEEKTAVETHCAICASCAAELAEMKGIASTFPLACEAASPSASLKRRIVSAARGDAAADRALRKRASLGASSWWGSAAAAAAAACIVGAIGYADHVRMVAEMASMQQRSASDQTRVAALQQQVAHGSEVFADIAQGRVWDRSGGRDAHWWHCTIVQPPKQKKAMLLAAMPAAPKGMTFQAWVIRAGTPHDAGTVPGGKTSMTDMPMPLQSGDIVAFTVEPMGGSQTPTMPYVMEQTL
jgi:anti-sigma-K factor RskA